MNECRELAEYVEGLNRHYCRMERIRLLILIYFVAMSAYTWGETWIYLALSLIR